MGMLMNIQEQPFTAKTEEIDLIGAPYIFQAKTGKKSWRFSVGGYVRDDEGSVLKLSNSAETAASRTASFTPATGICPAPTRTSSRR